MWERTHTRNDAVIHEQCSYLELGFTHSINKRRVSKREMVLSRVTTILGSASTIFIWTLGGRHSTAYSTDVNAGPSIVIPAHQFLAAATRECDLFARFFLLFLDEQP